MSLPKQSKKLYDYIDTELEVKLNTKYPYRNVKDVPFRVKNKSVYIHPTGESVVALSIQEGLLYQKAFGGVCLTSNDSQNYEYAGNAATVFMDDGFIYLSSDKLNTRFGYKLNAYGGFVRTRQPVTDSSINGELVPYKRTNMSDTYKHFASLPKTNLDIGDLRNSLTTRKHRDLYEEQEKVLQKLQSQDDGFHLLSGEVGVGKTHIAAKYINDYIEKNPNANVLIIEPIDGVVDRFKELIDRFISILFI